MTEHQFLSNSFFDNLNSNNPQNELSDAKDLIIAAQNAELDNKKFLNKQSNYLLIMGVIMMIVGILSIFYQEIGLVSLILGLAVSFPLLLQALSHQPDKSIKKKLQKFQKSLSQGLRKPVMKQVARSKTDRMIFGVFGGIAKYTGIPAWILRLIAVSLLFVSGGFVLIFYIAFASALPEEDSLPELED